MDELTLVLETLHIVVNVSGCCHWNEYKQATALVHCLTEVSVTKVKNH